MAPTPFKLIAFDLDGTLADSETLMVHDIILQLHEETDAVITFDHWMSFYHGMAGIPMLERIARDFKISNFDAADFLERRKNRIVSMLEIQGVNPAPGMFQAIRQLHAMGQPMVICSNSHAQRIIKTLATLKGQHAAGLQLPTVFPASHCYAAVGEPGRNPKPEPDVYLHAAAAMGLNPNNLQAELLVVEDSVTGAQAGLAAGATVWGYTGLAQHPQLELTKLQAAGVHQHFAHWDDFLPLLAKAGGEAAL